MRDLAVANAFFKPGPATGGMAENFVRRYRGEEDVEYLHPVLEPILRSTRGVLLFQEQILRVAREVAGLSWVEADALRRGMSKFEPATMDAIGMRFMHGCQRRAPSGPGLSSDQARLLWGQVKAFAGYGFNQGHATAYADVSYRSAYVKAHWPAAFLCARLANWGGYYHQAIYIAEARRLGIRVAPPHINHAGAQFTLTYREVDSGQPVLWMGLQQVRDLRRSAVDALVLERRQADYLGLADLMRRVDLQPKEITHLIQCGGSDGLGESRAALLEEHRRLLHAGAGQFTFDFINDETEPELAASRLAWEQRILGQPVSVHPLDLLDRAADCTAVKNLERHAGVTVRVAGVRLPAWTGGAGFFLADQSAFVAAMLPRGRSRPKPWKPFLATGRWIVDEWRGGYLAVDGLLER